MQKLLRTTSDIFYPIEDKSIYNDSIVFIEDTKEIWTHGIYYASINAEDVGEGEDIEDGDLPDSFSGNAKDVTYTSTEVEYNNVQDMLDYLLYLHKKDFDESFNMDFGYESTQMIAFDLTFDKTYN